MHAHGSRTPTAGLAGCALAGWSLTSPCSSALIRPGFVFRAFLKLGGRDEFDTSRLPVEPGRPDGLGVTPRTLQSGAMEVRLLEFGIPQVRLLQLGTPEVRLLQLGIPQVHLLQLGISQVRPPQICVTQVRLL